MRSVLAISVVFIIVIVLPNLVLQQALLDAFDYGDDEDDEQRLAEQRRHLMEEESRLRKR